MMRNRPKGVRRASFGFGLLLFAAMPNEIGYQDIASLLARQPGVAERWQKRVASSAATIQVATFSFGRPIGTASPRALRLASADRADEITGAIARNPLLTPPPRYDAADFPVVDRALKGDRLSLIAPNAPPPASLAPADHSPPLPDVKSAAAPLDPELAAALDAPPLSQYDAALSHELPREPSPAEPRDPFSVKTASLFFGSSSLGGGEALEAWQPGAEPMIVTPDPELKAATSTPPESAGESIASKGEPNAGIARPKTPAERLGLGDEKLRAKHEKCLAEAVYFEARGEAVRGQIAVAQVVVNRAFSGFYPATVCGVVYQNKHRRLACQFTFACDNVADVVREPDMWDRASKIAKATLDGQIWLPEVGKSTHYHAYWVRPSWVHEMKKLYKTGVHTFYRPRAWGDGANAPSWGTPEETATISAKLAEAKP